MIYIYSFWDTLVITSTLFILAVRRLKIKLILTNVNTKLDLLKINGLLHVKEADSMYEQQPKIAKIKTRSNMRILGYHGEQGSRK